MKKLLLILLCVPLMTLAQQTSPPLEYFNPIHSSYFKFVIHLKIWFKIQNKGSESKLA